MDSFQMERLSAAIISIAGCEAALENTLKYMTERETFGRKLNRFQALRHRIVELWADVEILRAYIDKVCEAHANGAFAVKECSIAKLKAAELAKKVSDECLQIYGGYGFMEEFPIARMYRDVRAGTIAGGTSEVMREIVAKIIFDGVTYQTAYEGPDSTKLNTPSMTAEKIIKSLPERIKQDKALTFEGIFHFILNGPGGGNFTVKVQKGDCQVWEGTLNEPTCIVKTDADVYSALEMGKMKPEEAFLSGKLQISNLPAMMEFISLFSKFKITP